MANPIQIKRSSTASAVPAAGSLLVGELAVNLADKKLYTKDGGGSVILLAKPTPGTSAQLLASDGSGGYAAVTVGSGLTLSSGTLTAAGGGGASTSIGTTPPSSPSAGDMWWDSENGRLKIYYNDGDSSQWVDASPSGNVVDLTSPGPIGSVTPNTGAFTTVSTNGNAGIGTASPAARLDVVGADSAVCYTYLRSYSSTAWQAPRIGTYRYRGTQASPTAVATGDELFSLEVSGRNANGTDTYAGGLGWYATGTVSGNNIPSYFTISTNATNGAVERVRVDSTGLSVTGAITATGNIALAAGNHLSFHGNLTASYYSIQAATAAPPYDFRFIGASDSVTPRNFSFGYYTSDDKTNTWNPKVTINSFTGLTTVSTSTENTAIFKSSGNYSYLRLQHTGTGACTWDLYTGVGSGSTTFGIANSGGTRFAINSSGNISLCTSSPINLTNANVVTIGNGSTSVNSVAVLYLRSGNGGGGSRDFSWEGDGSGSIVLKDRGYNGANNGTGALIGIPYSGSIRFYTYGAGTLVTDASGNITASSDARMKDVLGTFDRGLAAVCGITPQRFKWNAESGLDTEAVNAGFIAQDVLPHIPEAIHEKNDRYSMSDRPLIAALVNAVKELKALNDALVTRVTKLENKA